MTTSKPLPLAPSRPVFLRRRDGVRCRPAGPLASFALASLAATAPAGAQFGPTDALNSTVGEAFAPLLADLDGDGDLDVLATAFSDGRDVWIENLGGGLFGPQQVLGQVGPYTTEFVAADLDGDGVVDVAASSNSGGLRWYRGLGAGAFDAPQALASPGQVGVAMGLTARDLDLDGDVDLVCASLDLGLLLLPNLGGAFGAPQPVGTPGEELYSVTTGDLDQDGWPDVVIGTASNFPDRVAWLRNLGGLAFDAPVTLAGGLHTVADVQVGDLDGDGDPDVVASAEQTGELLWAENLGAGAFAPAALVLATSRPWRLDLGDVEGDGDLDVALSCHDQVGILHLENLGGATFAGPEVVVSSPVGDGAALGDLDGDGWVDLLGATDGDGLAWYAGGGATTFGPPIPLTRRLADVSGLAAGDLDGDGDTDLLAAVRGAGELVLLEQVAGGEYLAPQVLDPDCADCGHVRTCDVDGDGDLDVIHAGIDSGEVRWLENLGGTFAAPAGLLTGLGWIVDLELLDLDGDGDPELVVLDQDVHVAENLGGTFAAPSTHTGVLNPVALELGHLGGSAQPDIAVLAFNQLRVWWFRNLGGLEFAAPATASPPIDEPSDLALVDVDGDGDLDPVWVSWLSAQLAWSENLPNNTFGPGGVLDLLPGFGTKILAADLDTDGDADLAVGLWNLGGTYWYENLGGSFAPRRQLTAAVDDPAELIAADADADGDLDVLVASSGTDTVLRVRNASVPSVGQGLCAPAVPNSTGVPGVAFASGSVLSADDQLVLHGRELPPGRFGYFLTSLTPAVVPSVPGSSGVLCLGGSIGRLVGPGQVVQVSLAGTVQVDAGTAALPQGTSSVPVLPGQTWYFQLWHRDFDPGATSQFTNSVAVSFQ